MPLDRSSATYEMAHVLFVDIVGYSLETIDRQTELVTLLQETVQKTAEFRRAFDENELIPLPTGDGMGLVFLRDPLSPAKCAFEIAASLQRHRTLKVRMGIHTGPVQRHADIRGGANVVGSGINIAQRVMDCGDAGHILLSGHVAEVLDQFTDWRECLHDLGVHEVKHGVRIHLYSISRGSLGISEMPRKLSANTLTDPPQRVATLDVPWYRNILVHRSMFLACVLVVAGVIATALGGWLERGIASGQTTGAAAAALAFSGLYQGVVAAPRSPIPRYTAVIEIDPQQDPGLAGIHDLCRQRKMTASLVRLIAASMPRVIVIDKFFGTLECPGDVNPSLVAAISDVSLKVPVVVGRVITEGGYLQPSLFGEMKGLQGSIVNIDEDSRKLPLKWRVFPTRLEMERKRGLAWHDTLALAAARSYEGEQFLERHSRLAEILKSPTVHPYISFLEMNQFQQYRFLASYVLCGREVRPGEDVSSCPAPKEVLNALSGRAVLIGDITNEDEHLSVVGTLPGVYLQANFIEALLDDRYYEGYPSLNYVFGFVFLAGLETILVVFRRSWEKKLGAIIVLMIAMLFLLYIVISNFHLYVNPIPFIALALLVRGLAANVPGWQAKAPAPR